MKGIRLLLGTLILLSLAGGSSVLSQVKNAPAKTSYSYDEANQQTVRGSVVETKDFQCPVSGTLGSHITLKTDTGNIEVHLAPVSFMKQYDIRFRKDENVTIVGSKIDFEGKTTLVAKSLTIGRETFNFRDAKGRPLW